jgi:two-component system, NtrC family, nitrogen regulation response regulator GlnG
MTDRPTVLVVDDDRSMRWVLQKAIEQAGFSAVVESSAEHALETLKARRPSVMITDIRMTGMDGLALLAETRSRWPELPVIVITAHSDLDSAVAAYQGGAFEYLPKPFDVDEAIDLIRRAAKQHAPKSETPRTSLTKSTGMIGEAPAMQDVFRAIGRLSTSNINVLVTGESGTGKELVAHALHRHSPRRERPFIALNTAAIPRDLLESELFGHEKGAFTGAQQSRRGRFEQADGGTLFLDEIGDMPAELQTRLLRVLADGQFYRVGGHMPITVDVRIIAATHQDLQTRVTQGVFREDLFHRLNVIRIHLPALRERADDIPALAAFFLQLAATEIGVESKHLRQDVELYLMTLPWPGNVRQLQNTCRWLTVMANSKEIHLEDLPPDLRVQADHPAPSESDHWENSLASWAENAMARGEEGLLERALPNFERVMIEAAVRATGGRRQNAARLLGWGRNTLTRKIKELNMRI